MLTECDRGAQRSFFRTFEFDSFGSKQFGPPLVKSDSFDLKSRILEAVPASEIQGMGDIVKKASTGVRRQWHEGHSSEQDGLSKGGSDVPGVMVPGQRLTGRKAWVVWEVCESGLREEIS